MYLIRNLILNFSFLLLSMLSISINAGESRCTGKITNISISAAGLVRISGPGGLQNVYLCRVGTESNAAERCKTIYSTLLSAYMADKKVSLSQKPSREGSCAEQESWSTLDNLNWVELFE